MVWGELPISSLPNVLNADFLQHCQRLVPEYSKAAESLNPLISSYAVDCDEEANKRLCHEQDVKGFPTMKVRQ